MNGVRTSPTVAVIVNYNAGASLGAAIRSLDRAKAEGAVQALWVLDNASEDGSFDPQLIESFSAEWHAFPENVGFARAVNFAIARSGEANILLVNPDAEVLVPGLAALHRELRAHPDVAAVGGALQTMQGSVLPSAFPEPDLIWAISHLLNIKESGLGRLLRKWFPSIARRAAPYTATTTGEARDVDWVVGACMLLRSEAVRHVGLFDERFFLYYEEVDWCKRARVAGWKIRFVPQVAARHAVGTSAATAPALAIAARYTSMLRYFAKHHSVASTLVVRACGAVASSCRIVARPRHSATSRAALWAFLGVTTRR